MLEAEQDRVFAALIEPKTQQEVDEFVRRLEMEAGRGSVNATSHRLCTPWCALAASLKPRAWWGSLAMIRAGLVIS
jgi:hypothetical protein